VDRRHLLPSARLQDAGAIHHRIDAVEARAPRFRRHVLVEVAGDDFLAWEHAPRPLGVAHGAAQAVPRGDQRAGDLPADETGGAGDQDAHGATTLSQMAPNRFMKASIVGTIRGNRGAWPQQFSTTG
jgi:hypothetical protein